MAIEVSSPSAAAGANIESGMAASKPESRGLEMTSQPDAAKANPEKGQVFIKNRLNEIIKLPGGKTYQFKHTREVITDPELIKKLKQVADKYQIIIHEE